jgi:hypothetical protein
MIAWSRRLRGPGRSSGSRQPALAALIVLHVAAHLLLAAGRIACNRSAALAQPRKIRIDMVEIAADRGPAVTPREGACQPASIRKIGQQVFKRDSYVRERIAILGIKRLCSYDKSGKTSQGLGSALRR